MASNLEDPACWRAASPCPSTSSSPGLSCKAWFRCETAGDYIIRWQCQSLDEMKLNFTSTAFSLCHNQSDSRLFTECPPPVVCADDANKNNSQVNNSSPSMDISHVTGLAAFAFLVLLLVCISSCKYWTLRRRHKARESLRQRPEPYIIRDFPYPASYHSLWRPDVRQCSQHGGNKASYTSRSLSGPFLDVYFSRPHGSTRYLEQMLASSEDSIGNIIAEHTASSLPRGRIHTFSSRRGADPSVATESFVYHQPVRGGFVSEAGGSYRHNSHVHKESEDSDKSLECYHIYKGNLSKFRTHEEHYSSRKFAENKTEFHHLRTSNTNMAGTSVLSSIPIPAFGMSGIHQKGTSYAESLGSDLSLPEDSGSSFQSVPRHLQNISAHHRTPLGGEIHYNRHRQHWVKVRKIVTSHSNGAGPDVINSHNFSNKFVKVGKHIHKHGHSRTASSSSSSSSGYSISTTSNKIVDLSYDSFLNEHLKELAKKGAASSSTLEAAASKQKGKSKAKANTRY